MQKYVNKCDRLNNVFSKSGVRRMRSEVGGDSNATGKLSAECSNRASFKLLKL